MRRLVMPDLDLIKQVNQGRGGSVRSTPCILRALMKDATNTGAFAADLLQEQQQLVRDSMNGCRPPRLPGARPFRFGRKREGDKTCLLLATRPRRSVALQAAASSARWSAIRRRQRPRAGYRTRRQFGQITGSYGGLALVGTPATKQPRGPSTRLQRAFRENLGRLRPENLFFSKPKD
jgi:hypothetical protein